jgi:NAD(P)-dependent dehydrogenase (short-subunit alcohol dehydrogenase family)
VQRLASDGAQVAFTYAASPGPADNLRSEIAARGGTAMPIQADSRHLGQVSAAVDETASRLGGLDGRMDVCGPRPRLAEVAPFAHSSPSAHFEADASCAAWLSGRAYRYGNFRHRMQSRSRDSAESTGQGAYG